METQAQTMDSVKKEFKKRDNLLAQAMESLNPVFFFISSVVATIAVFCTAIYFVINLKVSPIEQDIVEIKSDIAELRAEMRSEIEGLKAEIKELDLKQEQRHNQLIQYLLNNKKGNK